MTDHVRWENYASGAPAATPAIIARAEARLGIAYPEDITPYFMRYPGYVTLPNVLRCDGLDLLFGLLLLFIEDRDQPFYSYSLDSALEAMSNFGANADGARIDFLPIASDMENGYFCYDFRRGADRPHGIVYLGTELDFDDRTSVIPVAASFEALLGMLK